MANENGKKVSTSVSLPVELDDALDAYCELYSCSRSGVIVQALIDYFARKEGQRPAFVKQYARTMRERLTTEK